MFKFIKKLLFIILIVFAIACSFVFYKGYKTYENVTSKISLEDKISQIKENSSYVQLDVLPIYYKNAVISVEDHRYYDHGAVDFIAITRAIISNIRNKDLLEGGSTITQQVAKNLYFIGTDTNSLYRKIAEIFLAYDLEELYSKDEILEFYVNTIYFGDGYYGIEEASNGYFYKSASDINLYEATMLAGIPNAPSIYAPTINLDLCLSRQKKVISTMVENGYLTQAEANELIETQFLYVKIYSLERLAYKLRTMFSF